MCEQPATSVPSPIKSTSLQVHSAFIKVHPIKKSRLFKQITRLASPPGSESGFYSTPSLSISLTWPRINKFSNWQYPQSIPLLPFINKKKTSNGSSKSNVLQKVGTDWPYMDNLKHLLPFDVAGHHHHPPEFCIYDQQTVAPQRNKLSSSQHKTFPLFLSFHLTISPWHLLVCRFQSQSRVCRKQLHDFDCIYNSIY